VAGVQNCLRGRTFQSMECFTTSQISTKNYIQVHTQVQSNVKQACHEHSQSWNAGSPFKIISSVTDGVSRPQAKAQTQVRMTQMQSNVTCTCCWIWTLEIALSSSDDKIITLALGFRGWGSLGNRGGRGQGGGVQNSGKGSRDRGTRKLGQNEQKTSTNMGLIYANTATYTSLCVWSITKECVKRNISN